MPKSYDDYEAELGGGAPVAPAKAPSFDDYEAELGAPARSELDTYILNRDKSPAPAPETAALNETLEAMPRATPVRTYARPQDMDVPSAESTFGISRPATQQEQVDTFMAPRLAKEESSRQAQAWVARNRYALANIAQGEALWGNRMNPEYFRKENGDLDPEKAYKFYDDIAKRHRKTFTTTEAITARAMDTFLKTGTLGLWTAYNGPGSVSNEDRAALANTPGVGGAVDIAAQTGAAIAGGMGTMSALNLVPRAQAVLIASGINPIRAAQIAPVIANGFQGGAMAFGETDSVGGALTGAVRDSMFAAGQTGISRAIAPLGSGRARMAGGEAIGFGLSAEALSLLQGEGIDPTRFMVNMGAGAAMGAAGGSPLRAGDRARAAQMKMDDAYTKARGMESALTDGTVPGPIVPAPDFVQRVRPEDVPLPVTRGDIETARAEGEARRRAAMAERGPDDAPLDLSELNAPRPYDTRPMGGEPRPPEAITTNYGEAPVGTKGGGPEAAPTDPLLPAPEGPQPYALEGRPNPMLRSDRPIGAEPVAEAPLGVKGTKAPGAKPDPEMDPLLPRGALPEATDADLAIWLAGADSRPVEAPPAADRPLGGAEVGVAPTGVPGTKGAVAKAPASTPKPAYLPPKTVAEGTSQQARLLAEAQAKLGGKPRKTRTSPQGGQVEPSTIAATVLNPRRLLAAAQEGQRYVMNRVGRGVASVLDLPRLAAKVAEITDGSWLPAPKAYRIRASEAMGEESLARHDAESVMRSIRVPKGADPEIGFRYLTGDATPADVDAAYGAGWSKRADAFKTLRTDNSVELEALDKDLSDLGIIERGDLLSPEAQAKYAGGDKYLVRQYEKILREEEKGGLATGGRRMPARHRREDIPLEKRIEMGEIRDPAVVMAATLAKQQTLIARAKFLRDVANNPRFSKPKEWDETNPDRPQLVDPGKGWVESQYTGKRWVRDYFAKDLEGSMGTKTGADKAGRFIDGLVSNWKWIVAAGRPAALGRDMLSNLTMLPEMAGQSYADPHTWVVGDKGAFNILRAKPGTPEWALKRELIKHGLTDSSSFEPDMLKMLDSVQSAEGATFADKVRSYYANKLDAAKRGDLIHAFPGAEVVVTPLEFIAKMKRLQDAYIRARSVALRMNGGDSLGEAIDFTRQQYPWYGANVSSRMKGGGVWGATARAAGPVPPFANFMEWSARYWAKQIVTQPLTVLGVMEGLKAITSYSQAANGVTDEDLADSQAVLQAYERPSLLRPMIGWNEETKSPKILDLSLSIPFGNEAEAMLNAIRGEGEEDNSAKFIPIGPFGSLLLQRMTNRSLLTGRDIKNPNDPKSLQDKAMSDFTVYALFPLARDIKKFKNALQDVPLDSRGKHAPDKLLTALDAFAGVKYRQADVPTARWYALRGVAEEISAKFQRMKAIEKNQKLSEADRIAASREAAVEIMRIYEKSIPMRLSGQRGRTKPPNVEAARAMSGEAADIAKAAAGGFTPAPTKGR